MAKSGITREQTSAFQQFVEAALDLSYEGRTLGDALLSSSAVVEPIETLGQQDKDFFNGALSALKAHAQLENLQEQRKLLGDDDPRGGLLDQIIEKRQGEANGSDEKFLHSVLEAGTGQAHPVTKFLEIQFAEVIPGSVTHVVCGVLHSISAAIFVPHLAIVWPAIRSLDSLCSMVFSPSVPAPGDPRSNRDRPAPLSKPQSSSRPMPSNRPQTWNRPQWGGPAGT